MQQSLVAIFCTSHADSVGNSCRIQLLAELSKKFDLLIVTNQEEYIRSLGLCEKVVSLPSLSYSLPNRLPILGKLLYAKKVAGILNNLCKGKKLFVFHDTSDYMLFLRKEIPIYTCVHQIHEFIGLSQRKGLTALITKLNGKLLLAGVKRSRIVFANFQTIADFLKQNGIKQEVIVTPHFIDRKCYIEKSPESKISLLLKNEKAKGAFVLTYTGWVSENRGLQLMLDVAVKLALKDNRFKLCIVGCQEEYKDRIECFAKENKVVDNIFVYGRVNYDLMPAILKSSDICLSFLEVNPVYSVSPPQKVVEYFAAGKPVIANHIVTHECLIQDGVNGYLLDDSDSIVRKAEEIASNKNLYERLSNNARKESDKYDKGIIVEKYYNGILR